MDNETITQIITVTGALGGAIIAGAVTLASQHIARKAENEKIKKQLLFKLLEGELKEKKEIIKPFIHFINSINLPSNFSFHDDGDSLDYAIVPRHNLIKSKASDFLLDYTLYMTQDLHDAIWSLTDAINDLSELESRLYDSSLSDYENEERLLFNCGNKPSKIWDALMELKKLLYSEVNITDRI